ncbi:MAG: short-chain dehydrogenase/reductase [Ilumatobacteraceae bacterium]|nr:short-chain dehydrogenase/reductase [Ilumatobacteraceae bacterium]
MATASPFRSALVTGASSGIGEAIAHQLGGSGVPTVLVARRTDRLEALAARYDGFEVLTADLNDADDLAAVVARVQSTADPVDLLVNNAGFGTSGSFADLDPDRLHDEIGLNVQALTRLSHAALATMVPRGRGYLLNVSSMAGFQPAPKLAVYAATKAYVTNLTESLHEEARGTGVHVTALCPGLTKTEFQSVSNSGSYATKYPPFAWLPVEAVASAGLADVARGRALSVPGVIYKGMAVATDVMPRRLVRRLSALVQRGSD